MKKHDIILFTSPGGSIGQSKALLTLRLWVRVPPGVQWYCIHEFVKKIPLLIITRSDIFFIYAHAGQRIFLLFLCRPFSPFDICKRYNLIIQFVSFANILFFMAGRHKIQEYSRKFGYDMHSLSCVPESNSPENSITVTIL